MRMAPAPPENGHDRAGSHLFGAAGVLGFGLGFSSRTSRSLDLAGLDLGEAAEPGQSYYVARYRPPFYEYSLLAVVDSNETYRLRYEEDGSIPSEFLFAAVIYVLLVVRWKPPAPTQPAAPASPPSTEG